MAMKSFSRSKSIAPYGLVSSDYLIVGALEKSPRINGKLVVRQNNLGNMSRVRGHFDTIDLYAYGNIFYQFSTATNLFSYFQRDDFSSTAYDMALVDDAVIDCYKKIYSKVANVADIIRTRTETVNMAANALRDLHKAYKAIRRGNIKRASSILGTRLHAKPKGSSAADRWLEYSYGWSPLVQDVYNILDKGFGDVSFTVNGRSKITGQRQTSYSWRNDGNGYHMGSGTFDYKQRATCTAELEIPNTAFAAASAWGLDNPAALVWEAIPYSFVIDWFYPVGDYLNDMMNLSGGITIKSMSVTQVSDGLLNATGSFCVSNKPEPAIPVTTGSLSYFSHNKQRTVGIRPRPLPRFNNPFTGLDRFWNQLALFKATVDRR